MSAKDWIIAEAGVLIRTAVIALVFYGAYSLVSGSSFSARAYAVIVAALFVLANAAFLYAKYSSPGLLAMARAMSDKVEGCD